LPVSGEIKLVYEDMQDYYDIENDNNYYITDIGESLNQTFIAQSFKISNNITGINKINIKLKDIGENGDTTNIIAATILECNTEGQPINENKEINIYNWNNVNTATGIIFDNQKLTFNGQEYNLQLETTGSNLNLYSGKL
jgi:hypothetical protein